MNVCALQLRADPDAMSFRPNWHRHVCHDTSIQWANSDENDYPLKNQISDITFLDMPRVKIGSCP